MGAQCYSLYTYPTFRTEVLFSSLKIWKSKLHRNKKNKTKQKTKKYDCPSPSRTLQSKVTFISCRVYNHAQKMFQNTCKWLQDHIDISLFRGIASHIVTGGRGVTSNQLFVKLVEIFVVPLNTWENALYSVWFCHFTPWTWLLKCPHSRPL